MVGPYQLESEHDGMLMVGPYQLDDGGVKKEEHDGMLMRASRRHISFRRPGLLN
jgi:hypothetical protein